MCPFVGLNFDYTSEKANEAIELVQAPERQILPGAWDGRNPTLVAYGVEVILSIWLIDPAGRIAAKDLTRRNSRQGAGSSAGPIAGYCMGQCDAADRGLPLLRTTNVFIPFTARRVLQLKLQARIVTLVTQREWEPLISRMTLMRRRDRFQASGSFCRSSSAFYPWNRSDPWSLSSFCGCGRAKRGRAGNCVAPFFVGKDARELEPLFWEVLPRHSNARTERSRSRPVRDCGCLLFPSWFTTRFR